jgi:transcriptional regulator with XRE-family HTH domain
MYRKKHGLVQKEVAWMLQITREHYALIEVGRQNPSPRLLQKMRKELGVVIEFRLEESSDTGSDPRIPLLELRVSEPKTSLP